MTITAVVYNAPLDASALVGKLRSETYTLRNNDFAPRTHAKRTQIEVVHKLLCARKTKQDYVLLVKLPEGEPLGNWTKLVDKRIVPFIDSLVVIYVGLVFGYATNYGETTS